MAYLNTVRQNQEYVVPTQNIAAAGAIGLLSGGLVTIAGTGALAVTLAAPARNGVTLTIVATAAQAHTVTYTTGFGAGGSSLDVATFGGAIGDSMTIVSANGTWYIVNLLNVTIG